MNPPPLRYGATGSRCTQINNSKGVDHQILPRKFASIRGLKAAQTRERVSLLELGRVLLDLGGIEINHFGIQIEFDLMESVDWFLDGLGQIFQTVDRLTVHSFYGHVVQLRVTDRVVVRQDLA